MNGLITDIINRVMSSSLNTFEGLVATLASSYGYSPRLALKSDTSVRVTTGDAVLVYPTSILYSEGNDRTRITTEIEFTLVKNATTYPNSQRVELWSRVKRDALEIVSMVKDHGDVVSLDELTVEPLTSSVTHYDEVALLITMKVISNYTISSADMFIC